MINAGTGSALALVMTGGIFVSGLQLAAPVIAAALTVEIASGSNGGEGISPQLPVIVVSIPLKTLVSYCVLIGSLAVWPAWIERHFAALMDQAAKLMAS